MDLDLETVEMLVKTLRDFAGTMPFVSHDRTSLRGVSNRASLGDGVRILFEEGARLRYAEKT